MISVNMLEAKSSLYRLVQAIEDGLESEIIIARNGRPAAKLVPIHNARHQQKLGIAKGLFEVPKSIDTNNEEVAKLISGKTP
jgi:antitoxin (DNA-binding transcriptional repressor) of toxin-antitoxin stability system